MTIPAVLAPAPTMARDTRAMTATAAAGPETIHGDRRAASAMMARAGTGPAVSGHIVRRGVPRMAAMTGPTGLVGGAMLVSGRTARRGVPRMAAVTGPVGGAMPVSGRTARRSGATMTAAATARTARRSGATITAAATVRTARPALAVLPSGLTERGPVAEPASPVATRGRATAREDIEPTPTSSA